jgi:serine/threonine protein kinase
MIDNRLNLRIGEVEYCVILKDFGPDHPTIGSEDENECLLWTAPELLQDHGLQPSQKSDIFALGIIIQEIVAWCMPYTMQFSQAVSNLALLETIAEKVADDKTVPPYRPVDPRHPDCSSGICSLIEACWATKPDNRPTISSVLNQLRKLENIDSKNLLEKILSQMKRNAEELEELVNLRTLDLIQERKKCDILLCEMLPR